MYSHGFGDVYLDFSVPVNNLRFNILNYLYSFGDPAAYIDIYVNRFYHSTYYPYGSYNQGIIPVNLSHIQSITGIAIYYTRNYTPQGQSVALYYDDFTFNPYFDVKITNGRVSGYLNGTTQKALVGVDVGLQATVLPSGETGGSFSWTFTGPHTMIGSPNSASVTIRPTDTGTITANVTYSRNTFRASGSITINVVLPTITSYAAFQDPDRITPFGTCDGGGPTFFTSYILGCPKFSRTDPGHIPGITYTVNAQLPAGQYLNDTSQAGIKYVQLVSALRKPLVYGSIVCTTARSQENQPDTGWQLDTTDPYNTGGVHSDPPQRFSGQSVTMVAEDSPKNFLQLFPDIYSQMDALFVDDYFETYVVYFVGSNASNPTFQRVLGLQSDSVAYIPWRWGGQVVFDAATPLKFSLQSHTQPGPIPAQAKSQMRPYSGNVANITALGQCPGGPARATKMIDVSKFFVWQHYWDFLGREPDQGGWDFWRGQITQCIFNTTCIQNKRIDVSRAFFYSGEFINSVPALAEANRGTDSYNREFVRQCYYRYLRRICDPEICDPGGFNFWVNKLNNQWPTMGDAAYNEMINAFIQSIEYRDRFPAVPNF